LSIDIATVILAGGNSSRIKGFKPLIKLLGRPLILYSIDIAHHISKNCYIIVKNHRQYLRLKDIIENKNVHVIIEPKKTNGFHSLFSALSTINHEFLFLIGCDTPLLEPTLPFLLYRHIGDFPAVVPGWSDGKLEPLAALYRKECFLKDFVPHSFHEFLMKIGAKIIYIDDLKINPISFFNINTIKDLEKIEDYININKNKTVNF